MDIKTKEPSEVEIQKLIDDAKEMGFTCTREEAIKIIKDVASESEALDRR